jgi:hypothetical protein
MTLLEIRSIIKSQTATLMLLILFLSSSICLAQDKYQWKYAGTENHCQIYTSAVPGKDYIAAKATCIIPARIETIGVILRDIANYPEWMEDCAETKILKTVDDEKDEFIFWFRQHIPLMTDRDMILKSRVLLNLKNGRDTIFVDSTDEMNYVAGKEYVRMPSFRAVWTLEWVDREHTRVTFMIDPDLGKGIPKLFANLLIKTNPYKSLKRMMKMVKDNKYIQEAQASKYNRLVEEAIRTGNLR